MRVLSILFLLAVLGALSIWLMNPENSASLDSPVETALEETPNAELDASAGGVQAAQAPGVAAIQREAATEVIGSVALEIHVRNKPAFRSTDPNMPKSDPAPWAEVYFFHQEQLREEAFRVRGQAAEVTPFFLLKHGQQALADEEGIVTIRVENKPLFLMVRRGWLYNQMLLKPEDYANTPLSMLLAVDWPLTVQVLDSDGLPASGVSLSIDEKPLDVSGDWRVSSSNKSNRDGKGVLSASDLMAWDGSPPMQKELFLSAIAPGHLPVTAKAELAFPQEEPFQLQLKPSGRILFKVLGEESVAGKATAVRVVDGKTQGGGSSRILKRNRAIFRHVALGQQYKITLRPEGIYRTITKVVAGPTSVGEDVLITMEPDDPMILSGRVVEASGEPRKSGKRRTVWFHSHGTEDYERRTTIEKDGTFEIVLPETMRGSILEVVSVYTQKNLVRSDPGAAPMDTAWRRLDLKLEGSVNVGDLMLGGYLGNEDSIAVGGRVLNELGEGVAAATVVAGRLEMLPSRSPNKLGLPAKNPDSLRGLTDDDGVFAIPGHALAFLMEVHVSHDDYVPASMSAVSFGTKDLEIVLGASGRLGYQLSWSEPKKGEADSNGGWSTHRPADDLHWSETGLVARMKSPGQSWADAASWVTTVGQQTSPAIAPGAYQFGVFLDGSLAPIAEASAVVVEAGTVNRDEEHFPINLSEFLQQATVHVESANGQRIQSPPFVELLHDGAVVGIFHPRRITNADVPVFLHRNRNAKLRVSCSGYQTKEILAEGEEITIQLEPISD